MCFRIYRQTNAESIRQNKYRPSHTLLDTIYALSQTPIETQREKLKDFVDRQIKAITLAWQDVVSGYAELQIAYLRLP
jgi:hypothetical protein